MAKIIKMKNLSTAIVSTMKKFEKIGTKAANTAIRLSAVETFSNIILDTPIDTGKAKASWIVGRVTNDQTRSKGGKNKGRTYVERSIPKTRQIDTLFLYNNVPYINMLEFGGYGFGPKTTVDGFSNQAPNGMVRLNLLFFPNLLNQNFKIKDNVL